MKSLVLLAVLAGVALPMAACESTLSEKDQTKQNWNGDVTHENTTVKQNDLTGKVTTEHEKDTN